MGCEIQQWSAKRTGEGLVVSGRGECSEGGYELRLELTNEGIVDEPDLIALRLNIDPPEAGPTVITPVTVEWSTDRGAGEIQRVRIDTPQGSELVYVTADGGGQRATGTSLESFSDAASSAFAQIEGDPQAEGAAAANVVRLWLTKGGIVGRTQYHVEISKIDRRD